jgi:hypothetical protein
MALDLLLRQGRRADEETLVALAAAEAAQPLFGLKRGRRSFTRAAAAIH